MADITIIIPSYNKGKYISEALDSVFMQETSYDYHIIVADDCSTDNTVEIVKEYQDKFPNKITVLTSEKNQKLYRNVLRAYEITKTDYFCVLDPDDFWIDKYKIQKALDFLEKNTDYTIYVTGTMMLLPDGTKKDFIKHNKIIDSSFDDFLNGKAALGCTLGSTFRNVVFKNGIPEKMRNPISESAERSFRGDTFRSVLHLYYGKAHCVPDSDAVYRITDDGLWQGISEIEQNIINANIFKDLWIFFDRKYPRLFYCSYNYYKRIINDFNFIKKLALIKEDIKKVNIVKNLCEFELILEENHNIIKDCYPKLTLINKVRLFLYKYLHKKLSKKGII